MLPIELEKTGLHINEAKVYLAALELGEANIQQLARKSGVIRTTVYGVVEQLKEHGLLSVIIKNKKAFYAAENPIKLKDSLKEKQYSLEKILPELLSITNTIDKKPKIKFFEGVGGMKDVYQDTLQYPDQELLTWVPKESVDVFDIEYLTNYYVPKRLENKIWVRALAPNDPDMSWFKEADEKSLRKTRLVSQEHFPFSVEINLYGKSKIGIVAFEEKIGLIIESEKIYNTLKSIFEINWAFAENK
jgi:sugar-specific transcriptional regulator TrmB